MSEEQAAAVVEKESQATAVASPHETRVARLQSIVAQARQLQTAVDMYQDEWRQAEGEIIRTAIRAQAKKEIYQLLSGEFFESVIASKAGQPDGFDIDTTEASQKPTNIRVAVATALLNGLRLDGKEFGVIAGGFYMERAGADRLLREWPGVTEVDYHLGLPDTTTRRGEAIVSCKLTFVLNGKPMSIEHLNTQEIDQRLAVRVNAGQGTDAIHGKARRKLAVRALQLLSGIPDIGGDADDQVTVVEPTESQPQHAAIENTAEEPIDAAVEPKNEIAEEQELNKQLFLTQLEEINLDDPENAKAAIEELVAKAKSHADMGEISPAGLAEIKTFATQQYKVCK